MTIPSATSYLHPIYIDRHTIYKFRQANCLPTIKYTVHGLIDLAKLNEKSITAIHKNDLLQFEDGKANAVEAARRCALYERSVARNWDKGWLSFRIDNPAADEPSLITLLGNYALGNWWSRRHLTHFETMPNFGFIIPDEYCHFARASAYLKQWPFQL